MNADLNKMVFLIRVICVHPRLNNVEILLGV